MPDTIRSPSMSPVLSAYVERHGLEASAFLSDGSLSLIFDAVHRVQVRPQSGGRLVLESELLDILSVPVAERGEVLVSLLRYAAVTVRDFAAGLVLDGVQQRLLQQQVLVAPVDLRQLEAELEDFVNVRAFWQGICARTVRLPDA